MFVTAAGGWGSSEAGGWGFWGSGKWEFFRVSSPTAVRQSLLPPPQARSPPWTTARLSSGTGATSCCGRKSLEQAPTHSQVPVDRLSPSTNEASTRPTAEGSLCSVFERQVRLWGPRPMAGAWRGGDGLEPGLSFGWEEHGVLRCHALKAVADLLAEGGPGLKPDLSRPPRRSPRAVSGWGCWWLLSKCLTPALWVNGTAIRRESGPSGNVETRLAGNLPGKYCVATGDCIPAPSRASGRACSHARHTTCTGRPQSSSWCR